MPALYTHYKFGQDVLQKLNKNLQKEINENINYYNMFNQGFDNLYYSLKNWQHYREFGSSSHKHDIDTFFYYAFNYIKDNKLENNSKVTNLIYGFINHYTLDTIIHPFINSHVKKLNIIHAKMELMLDLYLYIEYPRLKWQNKYYKKILPKVKFTKELNDLMNYIFENTYNEKNISKIYNNSYHNSYYLFKYFVSDMHNIKRFFYKIIDKLFKKKKIILAQNTFNQDFDIRILNENKLKWSHPKNKNEIYNYSFEELYNKARILATKLNKEAYQVLHNKKDLTEFIKEINNIDIKNIR